MWKANIAASVTWLLNAFQWLRHFSGLGLIQLIIERSMETGLSSSGRALMYYLPVNDHPSIKLSRFSAESEKKSEGSDV
jgi:hypothetical protein